MTVDEEVPGVSGSCRIFVKQNHQKPCGCKVHEPSRPSCRKIIYGPTMEAQPHEIREHSFDSSGGLCFTYFMDSSFCPQLTILVACIYEEYSSSSTGQGSSKFFLFGSSIPEVYTSGQGLSKYHFFNVIIRSNVSFTWGNNAN